MLHRIESDDGAFGYSAGVPASEPVVPAVAESDAHAGVLSHDRPRWPPDAIAISKAARELVSRLRPVVIAVKSFWDHRLRCIAIGGRRVSVDVSGSYRLET